MVLYVRYNGVNVCSFANAASSVARVLNRKTERCACKSKLNGFSSGSNCFNGCIKCRVSKSIYSCFGTIRLRHSKTGRRSQTLRS